MTRTPETLPKMAAGTLHWQFVRCGRPGCRCAAGRPHGPYAYIFWRVAGQLRKRYVPRPQVDAVRAACDARRALTRELRASRQVAKSLLENLRQGDAL